MAATKMKVTASKVKQNSIASGIVAFILALVIVSPLLYCLSASFLTEKQIFAKQILPTEFYGGNYVKALEQAPLFRFILNSIIVAGTCTFLQLFTGSLAGFAFGCLKFKGQNAIFKIFLATMMIPGNAIIISNYLTVSGWGLLKTNTLWPLILPYMTSAFCVFNMRQAYKSLPSELLEAADIDGCTTFQTFLRVAMPLTLPSLGAAGIQTFLSVWNQYLWPLLVTNSVNCRTVQLGIGMLQNADGQAFGTIMAGTTIVMIPSLLVFVIGQKTLISGLTAGAVKG
mgnify:CR=1 FL=1